MAKRDVFYRKLIKAKSPETKTRFSTLFKSYRNRIVDQCRQSKLNHFTRYFERNSKNMHKIWSGIGDLITLKSGRSASPISISVSRNEI